MLLVHTDTDTDTDTYGVVVLYLVELKDELPGVVQQSGSEQLLDIVEIVLNL